MAPEAPAPRAEVTVTPTREQERPAIESILRRCPNLAEPWVAAALDALDVYLYRLNQQDYQVFTAKLKGAVVGCVCFGRKRLTEATFEISTLAVDPDRQRQGIGHSLMSLAEYEMARQGGQLACVETASRPQCHAARKFYHDIGYRQAAVVAGYFAPGDAKVILTKKLAGAG